MLENLPVINQEDIEYARDVLVSALIERGSGVEDFEEGWRKLCPELILHNYHLAEAVARAANMVVAGFEPQLPQGVESALRLAICAAVLSALELVSRKLGEAELKRKLGLSAESPE